MVPSGFGLEATNTTGICKSSTMRVLFICDQPQVPGGVQFVCRQTVSGVQERGCDVAVLRPKPMATQGVDYAEPAHGYPLHTSSTAAIEGSLRRTFDSFMPDIVHVISVRWSVARQVNSTVKDVPWVLSIHNLPPYEAALAKCHDNDRLYYCLRNTRFAPNALMWAIGLREMGICSIGLPQLPSAVPHYPLQGR